jgi:hypothetical protein
MAHGGRSRPDVAFKDAAHSPIPGRMEPTIVPLQRSAFSSRAGRLELGADALTIAHPKLHKPVEIPLSTIAKVIAGPGAEVCRRTTIPAGVRPKGATLVLVLTTPAKMWLRGTLSREVTEIALAAADPAQAAITLSRLRVEPPAAPSAEQLRDARPLRVGLGLFVPGLIMFALMFGAQYGLRRTFPSKASAAAKETKAEKTEGRSRLPAVPSVKGAIVFRARAADGSLLYAWQTGDRLRVRVDTSPYDCTGTNWREWWDTSERASIPIAANGTIYDAHRRTDPVPAGGIDILTTYVQGTLHGGLLEISFDRIDDYRSAVGNGVCRRPETFSARRSG